MGLNDTAKEETIRNIRDFYIILVGVVIAYFIGVSVHYGTPNPINGNVTATPIDLVKWVGHRIFNEGTAPNGDSMVRSLGLTAVALVSIFLYAGSLGKYDSYLRNRKSRISLGREMIWVGFFIASPLLLLEAFSPSLSLAGYPKTEGSLVILSLAFGIMMPVLFINRSSKK